MSSPARSFSVTTDFPGGNAHVVRIENDEVWFKPDLRDTEGQWFYWCFRIDGAAGRTLRFHTAEPNRISDRGPAVSLDDGNTWRWLGSGSQDEFSYSFPSHAESVFFSVGMPYLERHLATFLGKYRMDSRLRIEALCLSRKGREVEKLVLSEPAGAEKPLVLLTARHHACEMMANYAIEGIVEAILSTGTANLILKDFQIVIVPFVDKDGVEDGDQGKNRRPWDHNRDYVEGSIHPEIKAVKELGRNPRLPVRFFLDLHCPGLKGQLHTVIHLVGSSRESVWREQMIFAGLLESANRGSLPYKASDNLPFGTAWNTRESGRHSTFWAERLDGIKLATSIEIPYAIANGVEVNQKSVRTFGHSLAEAMALYLSINRGRD